ncbi:DUF6313 family protein [Streptomyces sp. NPDC013161]|uniref:DUF6313 family protein n=1 Tax=Streptomyces sp. NPDC013161 TaxID=3364862 RepID=UPI0036A3F18C
MKSLQQLYAEDGESREFVEQFVNGPHNGRWSRAQDHWSRTVEHIAHNAKELESMHSDEAQHRAETLARTLAWTLAQMHKCWACAL